MRNCQQQITELMLEAGKTIPGDKHIDADFCNKFAELIVKDVLGCYNAIDNGNTVEGTDDFVKAVAKRYDL